MKEEKIIQRKIKTKKSLSEEEQMLIFEMEDPAYWLRKFVKSYKLASPNVEKKMILLRDVPLLNSYWQRYKVKTETLAFLFELGDAKLLKPCLKHNILPLEYQHKLLDLNDEELLRVYLDNWYLEDEPEVRMIKTVSKRLLSIYLRHHDLSPKSEVALVERNDENILAYYVSNRKLCDEARDRMYGKNNPKVVRYYTYAWVYPKAWAN